jgi:hypothetical protein
VAEEEGSLIRSKRTTANVLLKATETVRKFLMKGTKEL